MHRRAVFSTEIEEDNDGAMLIRAACMICFYRHTLAISVVTINSLSVSKTHKSKGDLFVAFMTVRT